LSTVFACPPPPPPAPALFPYTALFPSGSALAPGGPPPGPAPGAGEHAPAPVGPRAVLAVVTGDAAPLYAASPVTTARTARGPTRSEEHTSELQSREKRVCRPLLERKKQ